jgi:hypothetical protein
MASGPGGAGGAIVVALPGRCSPWSAQKAVLYATMRYLYVAPISSPECRWVAVSAAFSIAFAARLSRGSLWTGEPLCTTDPESSPVCVWVRRSFAPEGEAERAGAAPLGEVAASAGFVSGLHSVNAKYVAGKTGTQA